METKGHLANNGGLRGHSVGELYPLSWTWVGTYEDGSWVLMDLRTGEIVENSDGNDSSDR